MGNFYANLSVATADKTLVQSSLSQVASDHGFIGPSEGDWTTITSDAIDAQNQDDIDAYGKTLSDVLNAAVVSVMNHDDDVLSVALYRAHNRIAEYNSCPGYFAEMPSKAALQPAVRNVSEFVELASGVAEEDIVKLITEPSPIAFETHKALVQMFRLPRYSTGFGYRYVCMGEFSFLGENLTEFGQGSDKKI
ncbi:MAG: hypothetical protein AAF871_11530 [Pseudomonadota bacterium]